MTTASDVAEAVRSFRFRFANEDDLQAAIAEGLTTRGFQVEREVILRPGSRIDILVDRAIGVEVKITGSTDSVSRQVDRYLECTAIDGLVLVTASARHRSLPLHVQGKPVRIVTLEGAGL